MSFATGLPSFARRIARGGWLLTLGAAIVTELPAAPSGPVRAHIVIEDSPPVAPGIPAHVHPTGKAFTVRVKVDQPGIVCYWRDYRGNPFPAGAQPVALKPGARTALTAPSVLQGHFDLVFRSTDPAIALPERNPGEEREFGFAILPRRTVADRPPPDSTPFGIIHATIEDPYISGWVKTLGWTSPLAEWNDAIARRTTLRLRELPLVAREPWLIEGNDDAPVSSAQLADIYARFSERIHPAADPSRTLDHWELGLEENHRPNFVQPAYWANLVTKSKMIRELMIGGGYQPRLGYQLNGVAVSPTKTKVRDFLRHPAADNFDIFSLHPYAWRNPPEIPTDFPDPDAWLPQYLDDVHGLMTPGQRERLRIWFTEVGAPHHGQDPKVYFGYDKINARDNPKDGLSRARATVYLTRLHVLAFAHVPPTAMAPVVERIFWYNYRDRKDPMVPKHARPPRGDPEDFFGLIDYAFPDDRNHRYGGAGFPKPVYSAYFNLQDMLGGRTAVRSGLRTAGPGGIVKIAEFKSRNPAADPHDILVVWAYDSADAKASAQIVLPELRPELQPGDVADIRNTVGTPLHPAGPGFTDPLANATLTIDTFPLFLRVTHRP